MMYTKIEDVKKVQARVKVSLPLLNLKYTTGTIKSNSMNSVHMHPIRASFHVAMPTVETHIDPDENRWSVALYGMSIKC